jgi:hypothetical protein
VASLRLPSSIPESIADPRCMKKIKSRLSMARKLSSVDTKVQCPLPFRSALRFCVAL